MKHLIKPHNQDLITSLIVAVSSNDEGLKTSAEAHVIKWLASQKRPKEGSLSDNCNLTSNGSHGN